MAQTVLNAPTGPSANFSRPITAPSGNVYQLSPAGCAVVAQGDVASLVSQGFSAGPPFGPNIMTTTGVMTGTTPALVGVLPPGAYIQHIIINNTTANAVTGLSFGTTSATPTDIVAAATLAANALTFVTDALLLKRVFSVAAQQAIWMGATNWNSANVTVSIVWGYF
jgi:hypothetical protein